MEDILFEDVGRMALLIGFMFLIGYVCQEIYRKFNPWEEEDL